MYGLEQAPAPYRNSQGRRYLLLSLSCLLVIFIIILSARPRHGIASILMDFTSASYDAAANETLGFQKILALSTGTPWRMNGLRAAASHTGLHIDYPLQPQNPPEAVAAFEGFDQEETQRPEHGSALAWMGHLDLLKHVIQSGWTTALIMEDDADWDVALRDKIMMPLAIGVRNYTDALPEDITTPYGGNWDVLWMGHCGEWSHDDMPYHAWPDETVVPQAEYVGWASVDMIARMPEGMRTTHPTTNSVCTFAYAVTALGAQKIIHHLGGGAGEAYDVALSTACREKKLHCVTIHPEVFHQYEPSTSGGDSSEVRVLNGNGEVEAATPSETEMGSTANVRRSARCAALFNKPCQQLPLPREDS